MLSGYRLMWMIVMFDLPVGTAQDRKAATDFRFRLLDEGFEMAQYSVYFRYCVGPEQAEALTRRITSDLPEGGKIDVLFITDKQYQRIQSFQQGRAAGAKKNPEQFVLL